MPQSFLYSFTFCTENAFQKFLFLTLFERQRLIGILNNAVKYAYQSLPFFSLLAASLTGKCLSLFHSAKSELKRQRTLVFSVVFIGLFLLGATMFVNLCYAHLLSTADYLLFKVEPNVVYGYSLFNPTPTDEHSVLMGIQYLGLAVVLSGLAWAGRHTLVSLFERLRGLI